MPGHQPRLITSMWHDFRLSWKQLAATDIAYKIIGFIILTPLLGLLFRAAIFFSDRAVLADQDILLFLLEPIGWLALIVLGAIWISIIALEQAALIAVVFGACCDQRVSVRTALQFAARHAGATLLVTARMVIYILLTAAPFLAAGGGIYWWLLQDYDINYYLAEKPPVFWMAGALLAALLIPLVVVLIRMIVDWFFALPLLLLERVPATKVLALSRQRASGHRRQIAGWLFAWLLATWAISVLATTAVGLLAYHVAPQLTGSLTLLAFAIGTLLLLWLATNVATTLLSAITFAILLVNLYQRLAMRANVESRWLLLKNTPDSKIFLPSFRSSLVIIVSVAVLVSGTVGILFLRGVQLRDDVEIIAHRGASGSAPENSMAAFELAVQEGADWIELDVQETLDGHVVVVHDSDLKKIAGVNLKVWEAKLEQLRDIDIGSRVAPAFSSERIPRLEEVLQTFKGRIGVTIELKYYGHEQKLEQRVVEIVEACKMSDEVAIMSLKSQGIKKIKQLRPDWKTGLLTAVVVGKLTRTDADFLAVNRKLVTRQFVRAAHRSGKQVHVWTVNDPITMSAMIDRGVDRLITDYPGRAREVLEQRKELGSIERLLLQMAQLFRRTSA